MQRPEKIERGDKNTLYQDNIQLQSTKAIVLRWLPRFLLMQFMTKTVNTTVILIENYTSNVAMPDSVTEAFLYAACKKIID